MSSVPSIRTRSLKSNKDDVIIIQNDGIPPIESIDERTLSEPSSLPDSELDEKFSDISDVDETDEWTKRYNEKLKNKPALFLFVFFINARRNWSLLGLTVFNVIIFILAILLSTYCLLMYFNLENEPSPCVYIWEDWTNCSAKCWNDGEEIPFMTRKLQKVILSRGNHPQKCDPNITEGHEEKAYCNFFQCKNLSEINMGYGECLPVYIRDQQPRCYRTIKLPKENYFVKLDDTKLMEPCECNAAYQAFMEDL